MRSSRRYYSGGFRPVCRRQPGMYCEIPPAVDLFCSSTYLMSTGPGCNKLGLSRV
jgi:hypothetical protein